VGKRRRVAIPMLQRNGRGVQGPATRFCKKISQKTIFPGTNTQKNTKKKNRGGYSKKSGVFGLLAGGRLKKENARFRKKKKAVILIDRNQGQKD